MPGRWRPFAALTGAALAGCARPSPPVASAPLPSAPQAVPAVARAQDGETVADAPWVRRGACFVRVVQGVPCHGAPLDSPPQPMRLEVCDGCRVDDDCRTARGGRCVVVRGNTCALPQRACRYPNDACSRCEGQPTFTSPGCVNDGAGHAVCARTAPPPPAARR